MMLDDFLQECGGVAYKTLEKYAEGELPPLTVPQHLLTSGTAASTAGAVFAPAKGGAYVEWYCGPNLHLKPEQLDAFEKQGGWVIEPKHDGMWAMLVVGDPKHGKPHVIKSRDAKTGTVGGANAGDLVLCELPLTPGAVIVGELEAATETSTKFFEALGHRRLHVFDFPKGGGDHRAMPWTHRRALLEGVWSAFDAHAKSRFPIVESYSDKFRQRYDEWVENGLEGVVLKRKTSGYVQGKSNEWHRCKRTLTEDYVLVGVGFTDGGQLTGHWGGYRNGKLVHVMTGRCPEKYLKDPKCIGSLVAEFMGWQKMKSGALRHGQFVRVRTDKTAAMVELA
jgi:hypothetical protein